MKKVFILINHFQIPDGVARTAVGLANELATREDIEVTLCSIFKFDNKMLSWLNPRIKTKRFFGFYFRGFAKLVDLIPDSLLYKMLVTKKYDVEIGFCMELPIKIIAASKSNARKFAWMHGYDKGLTLLDCYKKMEKTVNVSREGADRFVAETNGTIASDYCYNLVDDNKVRRMGEEEISLKKTDAVTFTAIGRLEKGKGIKRLIECAARLKNEGYNLALWLVGDGEQRPELEEVTRKLNMQDCVHFLGTQANPHAYSAKADVLVCASYSEGYSTVCTEAIMLGTPVITTCVNGAKEIIADAECGIMTQMDDESLYLGLKQVLDNPELISQWRETLKTTKERFSYKERAGKLWKILDL